MGDISWVKSGKMDTDPWLAEAMTNKKQRNEKMVKHWRSFHFRAGA
jgi:hypothetical protein